MYVCVCVHTCMLLTVIIRSLCSLECRSPSPSKVGRTMNRTAGTPRVPGPRQGVDRATPEQSQSLPSWSLWTGRDTAIDKITTHMTSVKAVQDRDGQAWAT